jgi:DNA-binding phage protein
VALTREFNETVKARAARDPAFRIALLRESAESLLSGDVETGKALLRDYINATIGFEALAKATQTPSKSLMRMLSPGGNPQSKSLFAVTQHLQTQEGLRLEVRAVSRPAKRPAMPR